MKNDIGDIKDIQKVVDLQYRLLLEDAVTAPKFAHIHLPEHLPVIYSFWSFIVLGGEHSYRGNAFEKHVPLNLEPVHFDKWMGFLHESLFTQFSGPNADKFWNQARFFETVFRAKLIKKDAD